MATSAERMRALPERERRGLRRLTIDVSETDLQAIAERGYEGAASPTTISGRKLSVFFSPTPSCKSDRLNFCCGVTVTATLRVTVSCDDVTFALRRHGDAPPTPSGSSVFRRPPGGQMGHHQAAVLDRDLELVVLEEDPVSHPNCLT